MAQRILVTGGSGFVGGGLLRRLSTQGRSTVAAIRSAEVLLPDGAEAVQIGDLSAGTDWSRALAGVDVLVHCAARTHVMHDKSVAPLAIYRQVNVEGTLSLARQASIAGVRRFVFLSSIKVNGEATTLGRPFRADDIPAPEDAYGVSKREAEDGLMVLARKSGMEVVVIRPPLVYGPGVKGNFASMMRWLRQGIPIPLGAIRQNQRSLVALDNLLDLIVTCIDHPHAANELFLAADGEDVSTTDLVWRLAEAMNRPARLIPMPPWMLESAAALAGRRDIARRLCGSLQVDISKARSRLGWAPRLSVADALRHAVAPL